MFIFTKVASIMVGGNEENSCEITIRRFLAELSTWAEH